jgi:hypothetical protein
MRSIKKGAEPRKLIEWKAENLKETPDNLYYGGGGFPGEDVRKALLKEQFHLCAYTMKKLETADICNSKGLDTRDACHIEHILPQARGIPAETIDYQNMLACFPPSQANIACFYGAQFKGSFDPEKNRFVSPLSANVERHFDFGEDGEVIGVTDEGNATVNALNLNHKSLVADRAATIRGRLIPKTGKPISAADARRLAKTVVQPDTNNCLPQFCVAIAAAALAHAERVERRAKRLKGSRDR